MLIESYVKLLRYFSNVVTTTVTTKFVNDVTFFWWEKHLYKFPYNVNQLRKLFLNEQSLKAGLLSKKFSQKTSQKSL